MEMLRENIYEEIVNDILSCNKCILHKSRRKPVPGEGSINTEIMFIGEAPGAREDEMGRPFVGSAGRLLTTLIEGIGLSRDEVYITNVVKCRPPGNREPLGDEIAICNPYLRRQIRLIRPRIIVTLGRVSSRTVFQMAGEKFSSISRIHGEKFNLIIEGIGVTVIPTFHPAAALYNPAIKTLLIEDFKRIREVLSERGVGGPLDKYIS